MTTRIRRTLDAVYDDGALTDAQRQCLTRVIGEQIDAAWTEVEYFLRESGLYDTVALGSMQLTDTGL